MSNASLPPRPLPGLGIAALGPEEEALVIEVLRRKAPNRYYGLDPAVPPLMAAQLEKEFRGYVGTGFALAVTSGTAALEVAMASAGIGPGDEVIVTAWSWIACFTSIVRVGARPVLAEVDESLNMPAGEIARLATPRTRAVVVVHYQGVAAEIDAIVHEAHRLGIFVIEDCAQSLGTRYRGRQIGSFGDLATFSFQSNKVATAGEGGMVATRDRRMYERAVRFHDLGNYRPYHAAIAPPSEPAFAGDQFRMSELTAAVALAQLRKVDAIRAHVRALSDRIAARAARLPGLQPRRVPDPEGAFGFELYYFLRDARTVALFRAKLDALNVNCGARTGTYPQYNRDYVRTGLAHAPAASPFRDLPEWPAPGYRAVDFPRTEDLTTRFLAIPIGWLYTEAYSDHIASSIEAVHAEVFPG
jgi:8-amino-3,8-dideoxy-alpha-D-manno-octulosonate transaminase